MRRALRKWFRRHHREMPWRGTRDAYRVWVSEIMLQQTQVATVMPYFERFMAQFPTVQALAAADLSQVLKVWEGLGYYRRARQLHAAAQVVCREHGGSLPPSVEQLMRLPGIGRYTAGAIASIAYDLPAPIVEANTQRLYARLLAYRGELHATAAQRQLWQLAERLTPPRGAGEINQALMELGSLVCTPRDPRCDTCPLRAYCAAALRGWQANIPTAKRKPPTQPLRQAAVVLRHRGKVLLRLCGPDERWSGLWDFPRFDVAHDADGQKLQQQLIEGVRQQTGLVIVPGKWLTTLKHGVTRFRITLECFEAKLPDKLDQRGLSRHQAVESRSAPASANSELRWFKPLQLRNLPLSTTGRTLAQLIG